MKNVDYYAAADKAIQLLDRDALREFGRLKMSRFDNIHIIQDVVKLYHELAHKARRRYYEIGIEAYLLGLYFVEEEDIRKVSNVTQHAMADEAITPDWVDEILSQTDFVTLYRFDTETERKAQRLAEALSVTEERDTEIDRALKAWTKQVGQYAINVTDYAVMQAYEDSGVRYVRWEAQKDGRTCTKCESLDGRVFRITDTPPKVHSNCRCRVYPAKGPEDE